MNTNLIWVMVCIIGILIGSFYCISVKKDKIFFESLVAIVQGESALRDGNFEIFKKALCIHLIQLLGIWASGFTKTTRFVAVAILFFMSFSYGFSICGVLLLFGLKGIWMSLLLFGLQGVTLLFLGIMVGEHSLRYGLKGHEVYGATYRQLVVFCIAGALLISLVDAYIQPMVRSLF